MGGATRSHAARALLRGPGGAVRLAGLVCLVVAVVWRGPVDTALFSLVLAGLVVPLAAGAPRGLDAAYGVGLLAAAWCGALDLYQAVGWLDVVMHLVVTGLVAAVAHLLLARRTGAVACPARTSGGAERVGAIAVTTALGLALSVLWEVGEYLANTYVDPTIYVGYADTVGDLVAGGLGSAVAGAWLTAAQGAGRSSDDGRARRPGPSSGRAVPHGPT
ncbi:hypothetical protein [Cellulomonas wangsupingiae]|uniref:DUF2238 domain-containing protein n=1 Tax=Cellulomonas wangsupingiae TaxID=2968085 RepID=A0ABY5K381_9CELL|nr:hypothetical protein [Cellulomonas wangsupingiae]MCC2335399.1 hypothetical protein [Cellulomonas wangsupingiae]MCM0640069.1 hypothetical protein [Cellulomonas wangsupingiae]UUI64425.1 hypothetical protein NP075_15055 [Cellulomonas wangsupingiae]